MGLDWNIKRNGYELYQTRGFETLRCNGVTLDSYLDGTSAHMVADLGINPYYPLFTSDQQIRPNSTPLEISARSMKAVAKRIAERATEAEHLRIAAWLWTWAESDSESERITLGLSY